MTANEITSEWIGIRPEAPAEDVPRDGRTPKAGRVLIIDLDDLHAPGPEPVAVVIVHDTLADAGHIIR